MFDLLEAESSVRDPVTPARLTHPVRGEVAIEDVAFSYSPTLPEVLHGVTLRISAGEVVALVGPSGAGKTTIASLLARFWDVTGGRITFDGHNLVGRRSDQIAALGISRTFQNIRLFSEMTVQENLLVGMHPRLTQSLVDILLQTRRLRLEEKASRVT